jgi:hypothetical protein
LRAFPAATTPSSQLRPPPPPPAQDAGLAKAIAYFAKELDLAVPEGISENGVSTGGDGKPELDDPAATGIWAGAAINAGLTDAEKGIVEKDRVNIMITE